MYDIDINIIQEKMEKFGTGIAVVGTILFVAYIWKVMGYIYFKKGNIKKDFVMLIISLLIAAGGIAIGAYGARNNAPKGIPLPKNSIRIIQNISSEDASLKQKSEVGGNVYLNINDEDWQKYGERIKKDYIDWQKSLKASSDEETLKIQFDGIRKKVLERNN